MMYLIDAHRSAHQTSLSAGREDRTVDECPRAISSKTDRMEGTSNAAMQRASLEARHINHVPGSEGKEDSRPFFQGRAASKEHQAGT